MKALIVVVAMLVATPAHAVPCWLLKKKVAEYGLEVVINWAIAHGVSFTKIEEHKRRCLGY